MGGVKSNQDAVHTPKRPWPLTLVDTNVWRYLVDSDSIEELNRAARDGCGQILACPAVLYEMLRFSDAALRRQLVKAICRSRWQRLMPETFYETAELKAEISRLHPEWLRELPDRRSYYRLYNDWNGSRGVWWRARTDPAREAAALGVVEEDHLDRGRADTLRLRSEIGDLVTFDTVTLDKWTSTFPLNPPGWDGDPVQTWRAQSMAYFVDALLNPATHQSKAALEWLAPWLDIPRIRQEIASFARMFLYDTEIEQLPRSWLRWALQVLQATRTTNAGTAVDNQIGAYLLDADYFVTGDKTFAAIVERVAQENVVKIARPVRVNTNDCLGALAELLRCS